MTTTGLQDETAAGDPRCQAEGTYGQCQLHLGHPSLHHWSGGQGRKPFNWSTDPLNGYKERETIVQQKLPELEVIVEMLIRALDLPQSEHFEDTPRRVADLFREFRQEVDLVALVKNGFVEEREGHGAMVVQSNIPWVGMCAHHLVPFQGRAAIGYVPNKRIVGLSKLTRVIQAAGKLKPSTQEDITNLVADTLVHAIDPLGVMVVTEAEHGCMSARGVKVSGVLTTVSALRGNFVHVPAARQEFLALIRA